MMFLFYHNVIVLKERFYVRILFIFALQKDKLSKEEH